MSTTVSFWIFNIPIRVLSHTRGLLQHRIISSSGRHTKALVVDRRGWSLGGRPPPHPIRMFSAVANSALSSASFYGMSYVLAFLSNNQLLCVVPWGCAAPLEANSVVATKSTSALLHAPAECFLPIGWTSSVYCLAQPEGTLLWLLAMNLPLPPSGMLDLQAQCSIAVYLALSASSKLMLPSRRLSNSCSLSSSCQNE